MNQYMKAIIGFALAVVTVLTAQLTDNRITPAEAVVVAIALVNAFNVWLVPNLPAGIGKYAKALVVVSGTVLAAVTDQMLGGITISALLQLAVVALQALMVYLTPNAPLPAAARAGQLR